MIVTHASTTTTLTGSGTEDILTSPAVQGKYYFYADLNAMAANDVIAFRIYGMGVSGGTSRVMGMKTYYGVQPTDFKMKNIIADIMGVDCITNVFTTATALSFTATQIAGTGRAIPWHVDREDSLAPTTSGNTLDVTATGGAGVDWANVENPTTANGLTGTTISTSQVVASVTGATGSVTGNVGGNVTGSVGSVTGNVGGNVTGSVGSVTGNVGGNVTGSVGSLATQAKADVNAEVVDGLNVDTYAEPGQEAPGATVSLVKKIGYLYKFLRNKIETTATASKVYADDGTTVDQKTTVGDDATTYTRGEWGSGP